MTVRPDWFSTMSATYYMYNKLTQTQAIAGFEDYTYEALKDAIMPFSTDGTLESAVWNHYLQYGSAEGLPLRDSGGNVVLSPQVYCESKLAQLKAASYPNADTMTWENVLKIISDAGMSLYTHYMQFGAQEGLAISDTFDTGKYFAAKLEYVKTHTTQFPELAHLTTVAALSEYYAVNGVDAYQNWLDYGVAEGISAETVKPGGGVGPGLPTDGTTQYLKPLGWSGSMADGDLGYYYADNLTGTDGNDTFVAYIYGDQNSLNTGDSIDGKGGTDTLLADITGLCGLETGGYNSVLTPILKDVEVLKFRVQEQGSQTGDNNVMARIDAERIEGARQFWSSNSRDDLLIEDVRINSNTVTVGMQNTDPGDVDYKLYFDPQHLKANSATTSGTLTLKLLDTEGALSGNPLMDNPYNVVYIHYNGAELKIEFAKVNGTGDMDTMYEKLRAEIQTAVTAMGLDFKVTLGNTFTMVDSNSGITVQGKEILISGDGTFSVDKAAGDGWGSTGVMPPTTSVSATMTTVGSTDCPLIQTDVALDNVGRVQWDDASEACLPDNSIYGSNAGDMVIGSMATRGGVERFDVYVDRGSWLNSLSSTNNTLRMITVAAKDWDADGISGNESSPDVNGQLFIGAHATASLSGVNPSDQTQAKNVVNWQDATRVLSHSWSVTPVGATVPTTYDSGIKDVKYFEASGYTGDISIAAEFTVEAYDKYLKDVDGLRTVYSSYAPGGDFAYNFGSGNDTLNMKVNGSLATDRDFVLNMDMGAGDDYVNFQFSFVTGNQAINQNKLKNIAINTGAGDDTVWAWGAFNGTGDYNPNMWGFGVRDQKNLYWEGIAGTLEVRAGAGNDAVYTAQDAGTGNAVWVVNANAFANSNEHPLRIEYNSLGMAQPLDNNVASTNDYVIQKTGLTPNTNYDYTLHGVIRFLGIEVEFQAGKKTVTADSSGNTRYSYTADELNKMIIKAIEGDAQLNKLLAAFDGAGNSLLVQSLIDGRYTTDDFSIHYYDVLGDAAATEDHNLVMSNNSTVKQAYTSEAVSYIYNWAFEVDGLTYANPDASPETYTINFAGASVSYTQQAYDDDADGLVDRWDSWDDIVTALNAAAQTHDYSVSAGSGGAGTLTIVTNSQTVAAPAAPVVISTNTADETGGLAPAGQTGTFVGVLTFGTLDYTEATTYTITIGVDNITTIALSGLGTPGWNDFFTDLRTKVEGLSGGGKTYTVTDTSSGGTNSVQIKGEGLAYDPSTAITATAVVGGAATVNVDGTFAPDASAGADYFDASTIIGTLNVDLTNWAFTDQTSVAPADLRHVVYQLVIGYTDASDTSQTVTLTAYADDANGDGTVDDGASWANIITQLTTVALNPDYATFSADGYTLTTGGGGDGTVNITGTGVSDVTIDFGVSTYDGDVGTAQTTSGTIIDNPNHWSAATGDDYHYYGYTTAYGDEGDDVIVTGYADATVYGGAGNDTIVVGNETFNRIWAGTGADTIILGNLDQGNNGNNGGSGIDHLYQAKGDTGGVVVVEPTGTSVYVNTAGLDVIHNFDVAVGGFASDRLYISDYVTTMSGTTVDNPDLTSSGATSITNIKAYTTTGSTANDNCYTWVLGVYDDANNKFYVSSTAADNVDMLLVYDADSTSATTPTAAMQTWEAVVLTGVGAFGATTVNVTNGGGTPADVNHVDFFTIS